MIDIEWVEWVPLTLSELDYQLVRLTKENEMLLRYIVLHGQPQTSEDWERFEKWKEQELSAPECKAGRVESSPQTGPCCECPLQSEERGSCPYYHPTKETP